MKKLLVLLILSGSCVGTAMAQKNNVDSLQRAYNKNKQDTTLVQLLTEKARRVYLTTNTDSGMICSQQGLTLSKKIHYKKGEVRSLALIANFVGLRGDLPGSMQKTFALLPMAIEINDTNVIIQCYNNLALLYSTLKDYKKSLNYEFRALELAKKTKISELQLAIYNNIARNYLDINRLDSALYFNQIAYNQALKTGIDKNIGYPIRNFGIIQFKKGNYPGAIVYYKKSLQSKSAVGNHYLSSEDYRRAAEAFNSMKEIDSCVQYAKKAFEEAKLAHNPELVMKATSILTDVFQSIGNFKEAYNYEQIMTKAKDSLFSQQKTMQVQNLSFAEEQRKRELEAAQIAYQNKVRMYSLAAVLSAFVLIASILLFANQKRKKANTLLQQRNEQIENQHKALEKTLAELKTTQTQLIQSEKMASLGELTAGIAHEIQNPLNFVNNFSEVNAELIDEMQQEIAKGNFDEVKAIADDIKDNQQKISQHGKRADFIVKGMLQHSRTGTGEKQPTNINILADEFLKLSYHGLRAKDKNFNAELVTHFDPDIPKVNVVQQDMGRVLLNLFNNALYATNQKAKTSGADYKPEVSVSTIAENSQVIIKVKDNGSGIPDNIKDKIMQPFFTTKPTGEGTGLGLSLTYDMVVKGHGGKIDVDTKEGGYTEFTVSLPL